MGNKVFYKLLVVVGFLIWLIDTAYFGWKIKPVSGVDNMISTLGMVLVIWGVVGDIASNLTIIKETYHTGTVNAEKLYFHDERIGESKTEFKGKFGAAKDA